jgi:hypothetical protein
LGANEWTKEIAKKCGGKRENKSDSAFAFGELLRFEDAS